MEIENPKEKIVINRQELIRLLMELERRDVCFDFLLMNYMEQMEVMTRTLERALTERMVSDAKATLFNFVMPNQEWDEIITEECVLGWEADFKAQYGLSVRRLPPAGCGQ